MERIGGGKESELPFQTYNLKHRGIPVYSCLACSCVFEADALEEVQGFEHGRENYEVEDMEEKRTND